MKRIVCLAALCAAFLLRPVSAQETEPAPTSQLVGLALPANAVRVKAGKVPQEISAALAKALQMGGPTVKQGRDEVLAWTGAKYKAAQIKTIKSGLQKTLTDAGWSYEESAPAAAEGTTVVSVVRTFPTRKGLIGFWAPSNDALVLAWTEMLPAAAGQSAPATAPEQPASKPQPVETPPLATPDATAPAGAVTFDLSPNQGNINVTKSAMPTLPTFPKVAPKAGFVRGYVKDMNGKALKGAKIGVRSASAGGFYSGTQSQSDEKGYYEIEVPWGVASYYCAGYTMDWGEGRAAFGLHPVDGEAESFASAKGAVENWVLLPYGIADRDGVSDQPQYSGNYYGGSLSISYWVAEDSFSPESNLPAGSQVELTFTPTAPLLGGGQGKTFVIRKALKSSDRTSFYVNNLPITTYRLSGTLIQGGQRSQLHIKETGPYMNNAFGLDPKEADGSVTLTFRPGGAKADMATAAHGNWNSLDVTLSRPSK